MVSASPSPRRRRRRSSSDSDSYSSSSSSSVDLKRRRKESPAPRAPYPPSSPPARKPSPPRSRSATPDKYDDDLFDLDRLKYEEESGKHSHGNHLSRHHHHHHRDRHERDRDEERRKAEKEEKEQYMRIRRENRCILAEEGCRRHKCWENSPDRPERKSKIIRIETDSEADDSDMQSVDSTDCKKKRKYKKDTKEKKSKKKKRKSASDDDEWIEVTKETIEQKLKDSEEEEAFGPKIPKAELKDDITTQRIKYGKDLKAYEGRQMAAYVATGERIPRRGEIGMQSEDILKFEKMGYVMSGSRHRGMEAMRIRKENQIYSAEEKRMLNSLTQEERKKKETQVLNQFRQLIHQKKQQ